MFLMLSFLTQTAGGRMRTVGGEELSINHMNLCPSSCTEKPKERKAWEMEDDYRRSHLIKANISDAMWG